MQRLPNCLVLQCLCLRWELKLCNNRCFIKMDLSGSNCGSPCGTGFVFGFNTAGVLCCHPCGCLRLSGTESCFSVMSPLFFSLKLHFFFFCFFPLKQIHVCSFPLNRQMIFSVNKRDWDKKQRHKKKSWCSTLPIFYFHERVKLEENAHFSSKGKKEEHALFFQNHSLNPVHISFSHFHFVILCFCDLVNRVIFFTGPWFLCSPFFNDPSFSLGPFG